MSQQRFRLSGGTELSFTTAGDASMPAVLLLHGFPGSARTFREVVPELSRAAYVIAPDLPGFGESDVLPAVSFPAFGQAISELVDRLGTGPRYIYLHDFGAPQRALVRDYGNYVARFDEIAAYLARWQPRSLMLWGRHDPFFDLAEVLSWMRTLPRMEAHVFDAGHKLLETHAAAASSLMRDFIVHTQRESQASSEADRRG